MVLPIEKTECVRIVLLRTLKDEYDYHKVCKCQVNSIHKEKLNLFRIAMLNRMMAAKIYTKEEHGNSFEIGNPNFWIGD